MTQKSEERGEWSEKNGIFEGVGGKKIWIKRNFALNLQRKIQRRGLSLDALSIKRKVRATKSSAFLNGKPAATSGIM